MNPDRVQVVSSGKQTLKTIATVTNSGVRPIRRPDDNPVISRGFYRNF
jgi:hypothetical protein